jgi:hypothetical protein
VFDSAIRRNGRVISSSDRREVQKTEGKFYPQVFTIFASADIEFADERTSRIELQSWKIHQRQI